MDMTDGASLSTLLSSWKLTELLPQLQDENIGIDELRMMKRHHLAELLCSHKLGTRIRFEYNFERWRREQNKPLHDVITSNHQHCAIYPPPNAPTPPATSPQMTTMAQQASPIVNAVAPVEAIVNHKRQLLSRATNTVTVRCVNVATNTDGTNMMIKMPTKDTATSPATQLTGTTTMAVAATTIPKPPLTPPQTYQTQHHQTQQHQTHQQQQLVQSVHQPSQPFHLSQPSHAPAPPQPQPQPQPPPPPPLTLVQDVALREMPKLTRHPSLLEENVSSSAPVNVPSSHANTCPPIRSMKIPFMTLNDTDSEPTDNGPLLHILNSSGAKGQSLLEYYQQHQQLTNVHRTLLIQLIVNFFDMNEYHLSLKVSHNLERQILQLFPTEKLHYYRTEKRGRIYVKFCNMKRYKRDKPTLKRKYTDIMDFGEESGGAGSIGGGGGCENLFAEPDVGIECGEDNVGDFAQHFEEWQEEHSPNEVQVKTESISDGDF